MRDIAHERRGFTVIEILVVIGIIGLLAVMAMVGFARARDAAMEAKARADLDAIRSGIGILVQDTGKWPNGCPAEEVANPEIQLSAAQAGLKSPPTVGNQGGGCFWTADEVGKWNGPYAGFGSDPWGQEYHFDPDYQPYANCGSQTARTERPAIVSFGPNGTGLNGYDCDDIWLDLR
ncbi:prepilin-type N-terminal cleavage/methylation domain-containing protein [Candidatus Uhrbacteria bacterium]|nr:prepilin-type N-terminal cleavage/methylation domain-containing protein [Candidatus Uhrbacteria bacterium]